MTTIADVLAALLIAAVAVFQLALAAGSMTALLVVLCAFVARSGTGPA